MLASAFRHGKKVVFSSTSEIYGRNTAVPFANKDAVQLKAVQDFLKDGQVTIDVFGLVGGGEDPPVTARARIVERRIMIVTLSLGPRPGGPARWAEREFPRVIRWTVDRCRRFPFA